MRIERSVRPVLRFLKEGEQIEPEQSLGELGLDSLSPINLLFDLETKFGITIPDDALDENTFQRIASLKAVLEQLIGS